MDEHREFPMTEANFQAISRRVYQLAGINLGEQKKQLVYSRLAKRIRVLGLRSFDEYCQLVSDDRSPELLEFINAITTNLTSFFRENHHFEFLRDTVIPELKNRHRLDKRIRIWSAGCSSGEEPYSIAATIHPLLQNEHWDCRILATDLDSNVLEHARIGIYAEDKVNSLGENMVRALFDRRNPQSGYAIRKALQDYVTFKQLNLMHEWPMSGPIDVIFCRNVMIYFDKPTQLRLFEKFHNLLAPGGYLMIGHSESVHGMGSRFRNLGKTIYQKAVS